MPETKIAQNNQPISPNEPSEVHATQPNAASDDLDALIKALKGLEGKSGNKTLRKTLNWPNERYWAAHGRGIEQGKIIKGGGQGGSVKLSDIENPITQAMNADGEDSTREADLYPHAHKVIRDSWAQEANYDEHIAEVTAAQGRANTGGKWSRPDVSVLAIKAFPYLPSRIFEIITFEIKPDGQTTVEGVFEALSHQQFASKSFVIFHIKDENSASHFIEKIPNSERIIHTARKHGVGIIVAQNIADWDTWEEIVPAERCNPNPEQANRFIATCFSEEARETIIKWHK